MIDMMDLCEVYRIRYLIGGWEVVVVGEPKLDLETRPNLKDPYKYTNDSLKLTLLPVLAQQMHIVPVHSSFPLLGYCSLR